MKSLKRILAPLLSLILCMGLITFAAFAEGENEEEGETPAIIEQDALSEDSAQDEAEEPIAPDLSESTDEALEDEMPDTEQASDEEPLEPLALSVEQLKDAWIENGAAEFVVRISSNRENLQLTYQWQKLDTKGAFNEIEELEERSLAREAAWEDMEGETTEKLSFEGVEDYSEYQNLLFRCRVTAEGVIEYTDEVKLLPPADSEEQTAMDEQAEADEQTEVDPVVTAEDHLDEVGQAGEEPDEETPAEALVTEEQQDLVEEPALDEEATLVDLTWDEILSVGVFEVEESLTITADVVVPADAVLVIQSGELIVAPETTLTVEGLLIVEGGKLTILEGAELKNEMFIQVEGNGVLQVEGTYEQAEVAAFVWNAVDNDSVVEGINRNIIDKIILVPDAETLSIALSRDGFRTLTVLLTNAELAKMVDQIPNGVIISMR